jgi:hypothetical protein
MIFQREADCERHEIECTPVYTLSVRLSINVNEQINAPNRLYTEANVNVISCLYTTEINNDNKFTKTVYAEDGDDQVEIEYEVSKIVPLETDVKEELAVMKSKLLSSIKEEINTVKTLVESPEVSDKLDKSIERSIKLFNGSRNK